MNPESSEQPPEKKEPDVGAGFEYNDRPVRDIVWSVLFLVLVLLTVGFGAYAGIARNDDASQLFRKDYHRDPKYCPIPSDAAVRAFYAQNGEGGLSEVGGREVVVVEGDRVQRTLKQIGPATAEGAIRENDSSFLEFVDHAWFWILGAALAAVVLGFVFVLLFSYFASVMVYTVAALLVTVPLAAGIILVVLYDDLWGWAYIAAGVLIAIPLLCLHAQLRLTSKLLDLGADGIRDNLDLVFYSICSNLVLLICLGGLLCFGILALTNGKIVVNNRIYLPSFPNECVNIVRLEVDCCDWDMDNWVTGYWVLIIIMAIWTVFLINQIRVYVVAGVVSQWYFAEENERGNMSILTSLWYALGPSFGSLVLSSMILTISNIIRRMSEWLAKQAQEENARCKWLAVCLSCLIGAIAHIIEWVTDFATVRMSITGESFFTAGKNVVHMMTNNLINAYAIWWFPPIVLFVCSFLMSISVSTVLALAARNTWNDDGEVTDARAWSWYLFVIAFFLMMSVLHFFSTLLIDAVNTIFVCFAIDRENKTEKNPKAHEVFASLGLVPAIAGGSQNP